MKINKLNYENYVIDYIEGTLSKELKKDFDLFLEKNEDVYEEIKDYISAPVYEESDEVFTNKKSLRKTYTFKSYYLLALIPLLIGSIYFLSGNNTEEATKEIKIEPTQMVQQFAQQETKKIKEELKQNDNTEKIKVTQEREQTQKEKKQILKTTNNHYASSIPKKVITNKPTPTTAVIKELQHDKTKVKVATTVAEVLPEVKSQELIKTVASLDAIPLKGLENGKNIKLINNAVASITPTDKNLIDQILDNNTWLEMVTPASFENIDLRESLAIESNKNVNTSRKILNAFIPESLVK